MVSKGKLFCFDFFFFMFHAFIYLLLNFFIGCLGDLKSTLKLQFQACLLSQSLLKLGGQFFVLLLSDGNNALSVFQGFFIGTKGMVKLILQVLFLRQ